MATLLEMKHAETRRRVVVMQAYLDGQVVQAIQVGGGTWHDVSYPVWNWEEFDYRIKQDGA